MPALGTFFLALILWNLIPEVVREFGLGALGSPESTEPKVLWPLLSLLLLPMVLEYLLLWPETRGRRAHMPLRRGRLRRAHFVGSLTSLLCWCLALISFDWAGSVRSVVPVEAYGATLPVACLPLILGIALAALPLAWTAGHRSFLPLRREVWQSLRPNLFLLIPFTIIQGLEEWISLNPDQFQGLPLAGQAGLILFPVLLILILAPSLFEKVLQSVPLPPGTLKDRFLALCVKSGLTDVAPRIWRTGTRPVANAMMTGLFPYQRRVFLTDVLVNSMTPDELDAVLGHELAHARRSHLWIYLTSASSLVLWAYLMDFWMKDWVFEGFTPLVALIIFYFSFRKISHHMEHEADLFSESLSEKPGSLIQALLQLRRGGARWREKSSWRHPSILERVRVIHAHRENNDFRKTFDARGKRIRRWTLLALLSGAGLMAWQVQQAPPVVAWQLKVEEANDHIFAIQQRELRPVSTSQRIDQLTLSSEELLLQSITELRSIDSQHPLLRLFLLQLAQIYDRLDQPWNALACRLEAR